MKIATGFNTNLRIRKRWIYSSAILLTVVFKASILKLFGRSFTISDEIIFEILNDKSL